MTDRIFNVIVVGFALALVMGGGSSKPELATIGIRLAAIAIIAATLVRPIVKTRNAREYLSVWKWSLIAATMVAVQLVPLPIAWWSALPGRQPYLFAGVTDVTQFRPLSLTPDMTLGSLAGLVVPTAAAIIALRFGERWTWIAGSVLLIGALSAVVALLQLAPGGEALHWHGAVDEPTASGLFANRNHQAVFISCMMPLAIAWLYGPGKDELQLSPGSRLGIAVGCLGLLMLVAVSAGSRLGVFIAFGALICAMATIWSASRSRRRSSLPPRSWWLLAGGVGLSAATVTFFAALPNSGISRLFSEGIADRSRQDWLPVLIDMARSYFPVGSGFGSFDSVYRNFEPDALLRPEYLNQAHNDPLQLVIEGGLPAVVALAIGLVIWVRWTFILLRADGKAAHIIAGRAGIVITAICAVSSLFDYPLRTPLLASVFVIAFIWMRQAVRQVAPLPAQDRPVSSG